MHDHPMKKIHKSLIDRFISQLQVLPNVLIVHHPKVSLINVKKPPKNYMFGFSLNQRMHIDDFTKTLTEIALLLRCVKN